MDDYSGSGAGTGSGGSGAASNVFLVACPPKKFLIRDVGGVKLSVNPYLLQKTGQVIIFGEQRLDSNYIGPSRSLVYLSN
jgi:hypothetical protein